MYIYIYSIAGLESGIRAFFLGGKLPYIEYTLSVHMCSVISKCLLPNPPQTSQVLQLR